MMENSVSWTSGTIHLTMYFDALAKSDPNQTPNKQNPSSFVFLHESSSDTTSNIPLAKFLELF